MLNIGKCKVLRETRKSSIHIHWMILSLKPRTVKVMMKSDLIKSIWPSILTNIDQYWPSDLSSDLTCPKHVEHQCDKASNSKTLGYVRWSTLNNKDGAASRTSLRLSSWIVHGYVNANLGTSNCQPTHGRVQRCATSTTTRGFHY